MLSFLLTPTRSLVNIFLLTIACTITLPVSASNEIDKLYEKALIAFQNKDINTSIIHLKNVLQLDTEHMLSRVLLAELYIEQGNGIAAEVELNRTQNANIDNDRLVTLFAHAYLLQNKLDKVLEVTKPGLRNNTIESELLVFRGQAFIGQKLYRSADNAFEQALLLTPRSQLALLGRSQMSLLASKPSQALIYIEQALDSAKPFANGWILKSTILQKLNRYDEAMFAIDKALEIDDSHLAARLTKAMLLINIQEYQLAENHVNYIIKKIPNEPRAGYLKAIIDASSSDKENQSDDTKLSAVVATLSAVPDEVMSTTPDYYYLAGLTNFQFGNLTDARRYLTKYLTYENFDFDSVRMIAIIDLKQGDAESARNLLTKTNIARPSNPNILTLLGLSYLQLNQNDKAEYYFTQVLNTYPDSKLGITNLARSKMQSGEYKSAIDALLSIKDNTINPVQIKLLLIDSYEKTKQLAKAINVAQNLQTQFPENSFFQQRLGALYGLNGELPLARQAFTQALLLDDNNILAIVHLARMDNIQGNTDKALTFLQTQLVKFPLNMLIMLEIADTYLIKQEINNSLVWIKKAYAQTPSDYYVINKYTTILIANNSIDEAIDIVDSFIGQNNKEINALTLIATLYQKSNKHAQAVLALRDYVAKTQDKSKGYIKLAKAQLLANDSQGAIQSYKKSLVADENYLPAYFGLVDLIILKKDEDYALILINKIGLISKNKSLEARLLGDLYYEMNDMAKASTNFIAALKIADNQQALLGLYRTYKNEKTVIKAIPHIEKWLSKHPKDMIVQISLADSYRYSKQLKKSAKYYETLVTEYGELPILLNNLANVFFELGDTAKAKQYAEKAYGYLNENIAIIDTLAWIESRLGNNERALPLFRQVLIKDFNNAETKYHIAVTLDALNRKIEAKKFLIESVESKQEYPEKETAKALLATWLL